MIRTSGIHSIRLAESRGKSTNRKRNPEAEPTRHQSFFSGEQQTQPKIQYRGGPANYRLKVARIRQLSVDEPYFRSIKIKDGINVDYEWWQNHNACAAVRGQTNSFLL